MSGWKVIRLGTGLGFHAPEWDALNHRCFGGHPLLSSMFVESLLRAFGSGHEYLCILGEGVEVRAMLVVRRLNGFMWRSFLPPQCPLGPTMVPDAAMLDTLIDSLPGKALQLDLLCIDPHLSPLLATPSCPARQMEHVSTTSISLVGGFSDYWAARPHGLATSLRHYQRLAEQDGLAPRLARISTSDQIGAALVRYARLEGTGSDGRRDDALGATREQYGFYRDLLATAAERGNAVVYELWLGERLAASRMALSVAGMLVMLKTCDDEELAPYAPGQQLLRAVIEDTFTTHAEGRLEFCTDSSADQLEWGGSARWIRHISLFRNQALAFTDTLLRAWRGPRRTGTRRLSRDQPRDALPDGWVEVYTTPDALPADVKELLEKAETRNFGFGLDWYRNLVRTVYPRHEGVRLYVLRQDGKPCAVLPLRIEAERFGWQAHSLSNYYTTLYEPILVENARASSLLPLLARMHADFPSVGSLMLSPMARESHAYMVLLEGLALGGWLPFQFFAFGNWYQPVRAGWAEYLANRKSNLRNTLKRMSKKLANEGGTLEVVSLPEDMAKGIAAYEQVYAASWKTPEPFLEFMPGLMQTCAEKGTLRLGLAWLQGRPIAAQAWIVAHGRAEIYKVAYDEAFKEFSPGTLVTGMLIQHVMETDRVAEIDYLIGDDAYKKTWMDERRERWGIIAYNLRTLSGMLGATQETLRRLVKYAAHHLRRFRATTPPIVVKVKPPSSAS